MKNSIYLVVERSVGPLLDARLFLFIANLNHHAGINVVPNKLPGFRYIDGNLRDKQTRMTPSFNSDYFTVKNDNVVKVWVKFWI